ncbi:hypothetical protein GCK32_012580 [Trichostrongylus colubriformis]|uniref:Uncharacterized protein n=1 Tax=Trichostrongylus colubriformis TaxID=6319 RepID=A0AAN8FMK0_TRICO
MYPILDIILALISSWALIMCEKKTREQVQEEKPVSHAVSVPSTGSSSASSTVQPQRSITVSSNRISVVKKGSREFIKRNVKKLQDTFWAPLRETQTTTKAHDDERPSKKAKKARIPESPDSYHGMEEAEEEKRKAKAKEDRLVYTLKPKEQPELNRKALMIALGAKRVESVRSQ